CAATRRISSAPVCPRAPTMPMEYFLLMRVNPVGSGGGCAPPAIRCRGWRTRRYRAASRRRAAWVAQDAVLLRAQPGDGLARLLVEPAGLETDRSAAQGLERVTQQHQLALGIQPGALHARRVPGVADGQPRHLGLEPVQVRGAD